MVSHAVDVEVNAVHLRLNTILNLIVLNFVSPEPELKLSRWYFFTYLCTRITVIQSRVINLSIRCDRLLLLVFFPVISVRDEQAARKTEPLEITFIFV